MLVDEQNNSVQEQKPNDKEFNFRQIEKKLLEERAEKERLTRELEEVRKLQQQKSNDEDEDDSEPYIDKKRLNKTLLNLEKKFEEKIDRKAEEKARNILDHDRKESWIQANSDFYDVLQNAEKFAAQNPELAKSILQMPDTFERQKLVYSNIKALGLDKPESKKPSIQEKIDANRRSPYYQPTGVGTAPYSSSSDFSLAGQKNAFDKMQELKNRLRLG